MKKIILFFVLFSSVAFSQSPQAMQVKNGIMVDSIKTWRDAADRPLWIGRHDTTWMRIYRDSTVIYTGNVNVAKFSSGLMNLYGYSYIRDSLLIGATSSPITGNKLYVAGRANFQSTTEQLRLSYDATKYLSFAVDASNNLLMTKGGTRFFVSIGATNVTNLFIGGNAGNTTLSGTYNVALGDRAMQAVTSGLKNFALGSVSLYSLTTGQGNVVIGTDALSYLVGGDYNVSIGNESGYSLVSGSGNVFLGRQAGYSEIGSNKLYISNSSTANLIQGDFSTGRVGINVAPLAAFHSQSTSEQIRASYDVDNRWSATVNDAGTVKHDVTGDWVFNTTGKDIYPYVNYDQNLGLLTNKYKTIHAAELWLQTLVSDNVMATQYGHILTMPSTPLVADVGTDSVYIQTKLNNLSNGDRVVLIANGKYEQMTITSVAVANGSYYRYSVTRNSDGTGKNVWYAGDAVASTGQTGSGHIDQYAIRGWLDEKTGITTQYGPTMVGNVRTDTTYNAISPRWAIGELNGLYGYSTSTYGAAFGVPTGNWIKIDPTNGVRIGNNSTAYVTLNGTSLTISGYLGDGSAGDDVNAYSTVITGGHIALSSGTTGSLAGMTISTTALTATSGANSTIVSSGATAFQTGPTADPTFKVTQAGTMLLKSSSGSKYIDIGVGTTNEMQFFEGGVSKVRIGSSIIGAVAGIDITGIAKITGTTYSPLIVAWSASAATITALQVESVNTGGNQSIAVYAIASATGSVDQTKAIYGYAWGATTNWAGYFDAGDVKVVNNLYAGAYYTGTTAGYLFGTSGKSASDFAPAAGSSSLITLGTITTGHWHGDAIESAYIGAHGNHPSDYGTKTAFSELMYVWNSDLSEFVQAYKRTVTINGVTVNVLVID